MLSQVIEKTEFSLKINNMQMQGLVFGEAQKKPILALHGWLDNAASFELLAAQIQSRKIIALDLAGHGRSSHRPLDQSYYIWDNVTDIYRVMQALSIEKIDLIGHSLGASIAMLFAACFPEKVDKLFLIDGGAPLVCSTAKLPAKMAVAIRQRAKDRSGIVKCYPNIQSMVDARANSRFPVSQTASKLLVTRGAREAAGGYCWSTDPALLLPSIKRLSQLEIEVFLKAVKSPVHIYLADQGLSHDRWQPYFSLFENKKITTLVGNHHLHMQQSGAKEIGFLIDSVNACVD